MTDASPPPLHRRRHVRWRVLALGWAYVAVFAFAANRVTQMNALWLGLATLALALPPMLALWHRAVVRRLVVLQQFEPGGGLHRWGSRRAIDVAVRALLAIVWTAALLLQSAFFGALEWLLVASMPLLYLGVLHHVEAITGRQFRRPVYALPWAARASQALVVIVVATAWVGARLWLAEAPSVPLADRVHAMQSGWAQAPSGIVRWALDAGAWGQAGLEALGHLPQASRELPGWRLFAALVVAPLSVFGHLALSLNGLSLPRAEWRRVLGQRLSVDETPPPVGAARAAVWSAMSVIGVMLLGAALGSVDSRLQSGASAFAIQPLAECERIGGQVYRVGTIAELDALMTGLRDRLDAHRGSACQQLARVEHHAGQGVDAYLDWYFSLGAEWLRLATMLSGDIDLLLQTRFAQLVLSGAELERLLAGVQADYERQWEQLVGVRGRALDLLERNRLVLDERQCSAVAALPAHPWTQQLGDAQARLVAGSGAGLIAGAFAAKVTAKALGKISMKTAGKVLVKATVKKGVGKLGAAAAGAAVGSVVAPGVGTAMGAAIGAGVGLVVGTGVDIAALAAEERLSRADMRRELLDAVSESLAAYRDTFACR